MPLHVSHSGSPAVSASAGTNRCLWPQATWSRLSAPHLAHRSSGSELPESFGSGLSVHVIAVLPLGHAHGDGPHVVDQLLVQALAGIVRVPQDQDTGEVVQAPPEVLLPVRG